MWEPDDLIVASATVPGRGVRSIIRLSGEGLDGLLEELFVLPKPLPAGPRAIPATLRADRPGGEWGAIAIERRDGSEVRTIAGLTVSPDGTDVWNPAFDITPSALVTAIVTDRGVHRAPFAFV